MNRREFIKTAVAIGVIAALPSIPREDPYVNAAYPPGDIRRYGAIAGLDCTAACQAAIDDQTPRDIGIYIPAGEWPVYGTVDGTIRGYQIGIRVDA